MFEARLWAWQFKNYETTGVGRTIAQLENCDPLSVEQKAQLNEASAIAMEDRADKVRSMLLLRY